MENLKKSISEGEIAVKKILSDNKIAKSDEYILSVLLTLAKVYRYQIHSYLREQDTDETETEIRNHIKFIAKNILPLIEARIKRQKMKIKNLVSKKTSLEVDIETEKELLRNYLEVYDDYYALVACRSMEHFALYMEFDQSEKDKVWKYNLNCFHGFWYYANKMVLDHEYKTIEKQCPVGYGKSFSDIVMIAFIFGNDINADILKVTGNPQMVADGVEKLVKYMTTPRYAKVFPQFEEYNCDSSQMFSSLEKGSTRNPGRFLLRGSKKGCSFLMVNKDTPVDGGRFMWRFYDDITRSKDKSNISAHERDIAMYVSGWKKRKYDDERSFEIFSGTTYNIQDFLSYAKRTNGGENALQSPVNEFTRVNPIFKSVFVSVPKLDKNDNVTFPARYSRAEALQDRANDYETFMAMEMQTPVPLKGNPFAYGKIQTYSTIPREPSETDVCVATLDPARTGANYVAMPIMENVDGKYYLKDVIFELRPMAEMYGEIIAKIVNHRIVKLHIERNTDTSLKFLLDKMLAERGIHYCEITEVYSTQQKDRKIANAEAAIRNSMVFPEFGMYAQSSPMGEFMKWFTGYSYVTRNAYDDSADSLAIFAEKFIFGKAKTAKAYVLNIRH